MLVIRRKEKETFCLYPDDLPPGMTVAELFSGGVIAVTVKKIRRSEISLAIYAPKALAIKRDNAQMPDKK